ncbi:class I SAM-dependent methyltransferase [Dyella ginsengisoli]|uniref:Class I SAM-dependent methyltransferase n=1 Tax=Dyella ginsengisoli TaxID=363848 RepID=A0ABW8JU58_9GAMM
MSRIRQVAALVRRSPLHPQWLLGRRRPDEAVGQLHGRVLDVGCADRWIEAHCPYGIQYIGLDYPATGKTLYSARPDLFADATRLPLPDASVDAVLCFEVLEHLLDHQAALEQFSRVLKPAGTLLLSMPFLYPVHDAPHDYQRLTEFGLKRDLSRAGFKVIRLEKIGHAMRATGLLTCLALVGGLHTKARWIDFIRMPFAAIGVLLVNLASAGLATVLPDWDAIGTGYMIEAVKLSSDPPERGPPGAERQDPSNG